MAARQVACAELLVLNGPRMRLSTSISCRRAGRPADPLAGEAISLGEGAHDQHIAGAGGQRQPAVVILRRDIFGIGLIDHQQHMRRQGGMQPGKFGAWQEAAGRVVGIGDEDHPRPLGHACQQRIDVGAVIGIGRDHRRRPAAPRRDIVEREAIAHIEHLVARPGKSRCRDGEQFARAGAADDRAPDRCRAARPAPRAAPCCRDRDRARGSALPRAPPAPRGWCPAGSRWRKA